MFPSCSFWQLEISKQLFHAWQSRTVELKDKVWQIIGKRCIQPIFILNKNKRKKGIGNKILYTRFELGCSKPSCIFIPMLNVQIQSWENWTPAQIGRLDWVGGAEQDSSCLLCLQTPPPLLCGSHPLCSLFLVCKLSTLGWTIPTLHCWWSILVWHKNMFSANI